MVENEDYGEFKGSTRQAIAEIRDDVRAMRAQLDHVCVDHEKRLWAIESSARFFRWIVMGILAMLTYLGLRP